MINYTYDPLERLHHGLSHVSDDCALWRPDPDANSIAITVWHMARIFDVFLTQQAKGDSSREECWFRSGWAEQTGYDPRGRGQNGWGMLTGYTQAEVAALPQLAMAQVLDYLDVVYDTVKKYLANMSIEELQTPGAGFDGKYTKYQCIQMALLDNVRHLGEIFAIEARWNRQEKQ